MLLLIGVLLFALIVVGALLGRITWDRAIILTLVALVVLAVIYVLVGHFG